MDSSHRRLIWLLGGLALAAAGSAGAQSSSDRVYPTPGYYDLGLSARTFEAPLFGTDSVATYRLFANQRFEDGGNYSVWLNGGFPSYTPQYGIEGDRIPLGDFTAKVNAGDFLLGSLVPEALSDGASGAFPVDGGRLLASRDRSTWGFFAARAKYDVELPGRPKVRPGLYGGEYLGRWDANQFGAGVTLVDTPIYGDGETAKRRDVVLSGRYFRELSPWAHLFCEALFAGSGNFGYRAGAHWKLQNGSLSSSLYSFAGGFPFVYPLYRPGERGIEVRGRFDPSEFSTLHGHLYYASDPEVLRRTELRGNVGFGLRFGSNRPSLSVDYSRDDVVHDSLVAPASSLLVDRFAVSLGQDLPSGFSSLTLERDRSAHDAGLDRTQALFVYRTIVGSGSLLDGSMVAQRDESGNLGVTADSVVERPFGNRFYYLLGLGGAYLDRGAAASGEGVLRMGISRRFVGRGWHARLEVRLPFSVGLDRSALNRRIVSLDLGNRFGWADLRSLRPSSSGAPGEPATGSVEGVVSREGVGQPGVPILVDGERMSVTRSDGSFRIRRVPAGRRHVTLDLRPLDPRYGVVGGLSRDVEVEPRAVARLDLTIAPFSTFQGALVACDGGRTVPVAGARLTLEGDGFSRTVHSSVAGGFQFGEVPPAAYELTIDSAPLARSVSDKESQRLRVDLTRDRLGCLIRILCPDDAGSSAERGPVCAE